MEHSTPFPFEYPEAYLADHVNHVHSFGSASEGQQSHNGVGHSSQGFHEAFDSSQRLHPPQTTSPANYSPAPLEHTQSFGSAYHHLCGYGQTFANTFGQQTHWDYNSSPVNANFNGSSSNLWAPVQQEPLNGFNFNAPLNSQPVTSSYETQLLDGDDASHAEMLCHPVDASQLTPSSSLMSATATSSPTPELASFVVEENGTHDCQWVLDGGMVCGKQFNDNRELHDHIAGVHVEALQADGHDGFTCRWAGCSRQTDEKFQNKRGFTARSKLKRHLNIHTGPGKSLYLISSNLMCFSAEVQTALEAVPL